MRVRRGVTVALQVIVLATLAVAFFVRLPQVSGLSMAPRIGSGETVVIDTIAYRFVPIRRGDVVAFHHGPAGDAYIKRVIGLPGERIALHDGIVSIDGAALHERYVAFRDHATVAETTVPADAYYVLGDNRANSDDSRDWGPVAGSSIFGQARFAIWPLDRIGRI